MPEWIQNPLIWIFTLSLLGGVLTAGIWIGSVNRDRKSFDVFMKEVRKDIKEILLRLSNQPPSTVAGQSPVQLTDFGKKISKTVQSSEWAKENASDLVADATGKEEFEIFDICVNHVSQTFESDPKFQAVVRSAAYQHGIEPEGVLKVYHVELRDRLLTLIAS